MLSQINKDILVNSPIYSALLEMGLSADILESIRIRDNSLGLPFHLWSLSASGDLPLGALFYATTLAVHRVLLEGHTLSLADRTAAWDRVTNAEKAATAEAAERLARQKQSERARRPRAKVIFDGLTIEQVIERLCAKNRDLSSKELWDKFLSKLENDCLDPNCYADKHGSERVEFNTDLNRRKEVAFRTFQNLVSKVRSEKVHGSRG